ncbi:MAG: hypothetical protein E6R06_32135 [Mycobacterium sp.]|nr:MAG: hypothetical protein E6R06_32135 [Mycobacterium sp.]
MAQRRTRDDLLELFEEQVEFLERSNAAFDEGHLSEAKRIAVPLRVLFHHTSRSHSLLNQLGLGKVTRLGLKVPLAWVDTAGRPDPNNLISEWGLVQSGINIEDGKGTPVFRAPLGDRPAMMIRVGSRLLPRGSRIPFEEWWTEPVTRDADRTEFSRKDFVLALANKEGGAHVDPEIHESYNKIANLNSMGWTYSEGPGGRALTSPPIPVGASAPAGTSAPIAPTKVPEPKGDKTDEIALGNPVPYIVRQISYEVVESVKQQRHLIN